MAIEAFQTSGVGVFVASSMKLSRLTFSPERFPSPTARQRTSHHILILFGWILDLWGNPKKVVVLITPPIGYNNNYSLALLGAVALLVLTQTINASPRAITHKYCTIKNTDIETLTSTETDSTTTDAPTPKSFVVASTTNATETEACFTTTMTTVIGFIPVQSSVMRGANKRK